MVGTRIRPRFTLLELLVVVTCISVGSALIASAMERARRRRLRPGSWCQSNLSNYECVLVSTWTTPEALCLWQAVKRERPAAIGIKR